MTAVPRWCKGQAETGVRKSGTRREWRDRERVMRSLKRGDSPVLTGMQIHHNFIRPRMGPNGKTPTEAAGIRVEGKTSG